MLSELDQHAFEIRQMLENTPMLRSMYNVTIGMIKRYCTLSVKNEAARRDVWWPFITRCYLDIVAYGMCAYYKTQKQGVVFPVYVPVSSCTISVTEDYGMKVTPRYKFKDLRPARIRVYVGYPAFFDTMRLSSPMARILPQFKRMNELSNCYLEQERRISNPVVMLEDTRMGSSDSIYQAVSAENPDWESGISGLSMSAKDTASQQAKINQFIATLQENMVDIINHGGSNPESAVDNLGIRKDTKRKRIQDTHIPLPAYKRPHITSPTNRVRILDFEKAFKEYCPWIFGFPLSFLESGLAKVGANFKLLEMAAQTGINEHVDQLNPMLESVSHDLFSVHEMLIDSPMRVILKVTEEEIDYDDSPAASKEENSTKGPEKSLSSDEKDSTEESGSPESGKETGESGDHLKADDILKKLVDAIQALSEKRQ